MVLKKGGKDKDDKKKDDKNDKKKTTSHKPKVKKEEKPKELSARQKKRQELFEQAQERLLQKFIKPVQQEQIPPEVELGKNVQEFIARKQKAKYIRRPKQYLKKQETQKQVQEVPLKEVPQEEPLKDIPQEQPQQQVQEDPQREFAFGENILKLLADKGVDPAVANIKEVEKQDIKYDIYNRVEGDVDQYNAIRRPRYQLMPFIDYDETLAKQAAEDEAENLFDMDQLKRETEPAKRSELPPQKPKKTKEQKQEERSKEDKEMEQQVLLSIKDKQKEINETQRQLAKQKMINQYRLQKLHESMAYEDRELLERNNIEIEKINQQLNEIEQESNFFSEQISDLTNIEQKILQLQQQEGWAEQVSEIQQVSFPIQEQQEQNQELQAQEIQEPNVDLQVQQNLEQNEKVQEIQQINYDDYSDVDDMPDAEIERRYNDAEFMANLKKKNPLMYKQYKNIQNENEFQQRQREADLREQVQEQDQEQEQEQDQEQVQQVMDAFPEVLDHELPEDEVKLRYNNVEFMTNLMRSSQVGRYVWFQTQKARSKLAQGDAQEILNDLNDQQESEIINDQQEIQNDQQLPEILIQQNQFADELKGTTLFREIGAQPNLYEDGNTKIVDIARNRLLYFSQARDTFDFTEQEYNFDDAQVTFEMFINIFQLDNLNINQDSLRDIFKRIEDRLADILNFMNGFPPNFFEISPIEQISNEVAQQMESFHLVMHALNETFADLFIVIEQNMRNNNHFIRIPIVKILNEQNNIYQSLSSIAKANNQLTEIQVQKRNEIQNAFTTYLFGDGAPDIINQEYQENIMDAFMRDWQILAQFNNVDILDYYTYLQNFYAVPMRKILMFQDDPQFQQRRVYFQDPAITDFIQEEQIRQNIGEFDNISKFFSIYKLNFELYKHDQVFKNVTQAALSGQQLWITCFFTQIVKFLTFQYQFNTQDSNRLLRFLFFARVQPVNQIYYQDQANTLNQVRDVIAEIRAEAEKCEILGDISPAIWVLQIMRSLTNKLSIKKSLNDNFLSTVLEGDIIKHALVIQKVSNFINVNEVQLVPDRIIQDTQIYIPREMQNQSNEDVILTRAALELKQAFYTAYLKYKYNIQGNTLETNQYQRDVKPQFIQNCSGIMIGENIYNLTRNMPSTDVRQIFIIIKIVVFLDCLENIKDVRVVTEEDGGKFTSKDLEYNNNLGQSKNNRIINQVKKPFYITFTVNNVFKYPEDPNNPLEMNVQDLILSGLCYQIVKYIPAFYRGELDTAHNENYAKIDIPLNIEKVQFFFITFVQLFFEEERAQRWIAHANKRFFNVASQRKQKQFVTGATCYFSGELFYQDQVSGDHYGPEIKNMFNQFISAVFRDDHFQGDNVARFRAWQNQFPFAQAQTNQMMDINGNMNDQHDIEEEDDEQPQQGMEQENEQEQNQLEIEDQEEEQVQSSVVQSQNNQNRDGNQILALVSFQITGYNVYALQMRTTTQLFQGIVEQMKLNRIFISFNGLNVSRTLFPLQLSIDRTALRTGNLQQYFQLEEGQDFKKLVQLYSSIQTKYQAGAGSSLGMFFYLRESWPEQILQQTSNYSQQIVEVNISNVAPLNCAQVVFLSFMCYIITLNQNNDFYLFNDVRTITRLLEKIKNRAYDRWPLGADTFNVKFNKYLQDLYTFPVLLIQYFQNIFLDLKSYFQKNHQIFYIHEMPVYYINNDTVKSKDYQPFQVNILTLIPHCNCYGLIIYKAHIELFDDRAEFLKAKIVLWRTYTVEEDRKIKIVTKGRDCYLNNMKIGDEMNKRQKEWLLEAKQMQDQVVVFYDLETACTGEMKPYLIIFSIQFFGEYVQKTLMNFIDNLEEIFNIRMEIRRTHRFYIIEADFNNTPEIIVDQFISILDTMQKILTEEHAHKKKIQITVIAHNGAKFDNIIIMPAIFKKWKEEVQIFGKLSFPKCIVAAKVIYFQDSIIMTQLGSLNKACKEMGISGSKLNAPLAVNRKLWTDYCVLPRRQMLDIIEYCIQDVFMLKVLILRFNIMIQENMNLIFQQIFGRENYLIPNSTIGEIFYLKISLSQLAVTILQKYSLTPGQKLLGLTNQIQYAAASISMRGGLTQVYNYKKHDCVFAVDINSSYPTRMSQNTFPYGFEELPRRCDLNYIQKHIDNMKIENIDPYSLYFISYFNLPDEAKFGFFRIKDNKNEDGKMQDGLLFNPKSFGKLDSDLNDPLHPERLIQAVLLSFYLPTNEILFCTFGRSIQIAARLFGSALKIQCVGVLIALKQNIQNPHNPFKQCIEALFNIRLEQKQLGNNARQLGCKILSNSIYGKLGQRKFDIKKFLLSDLHLIDEQQDPEAKQYAKAQVLKQYLQELAVTLDKYQRMDDKTQNYLPKDIYKILQSPHISFTEVSKTNMMCVNIKHCGTIEQSEFEKEGIITCLGITYASFITASARDYLLWAVYTIHRTQLVDILYCDTDSIYFSVKQIYQNRIPYVYKIIDSLKQEIYFDWQLKKQEVFTFKFGKLLGQWSINDGNKMKTYEEPNDKITIPEYYSSFIAFGKKFYICWTNSMAAMAASQNYDEVCLKLKGISQNNKKAVQQLIILLSDPLYDRDKIIQLIQDRWLRNGLQLQIKPMKIQIQTQILEKINPETGEMILFLNFQEKRLYKLNLQNIQKQVFKLQ